MQLEHTHTGQAAQCAGNQSRGGGADRESAAEHQPAQQSGGDSMEKTGEQTRDAGHTRELKSQGHSAYLNFAAVHREVQNPLPTFECSC